MLPSLREKRRYVVFEIVSERDFDLGEVVEAVWEGLISYMGERGVGLANPWIMKDLFYPEKQVGGIRIEKNSVQDVRTALALVDRIDGEKVCLYMRGVSGSIKKAREKFLDV